MTIADKLTQLNIIKQDIKTAINNKGGSVSNNFTTYANAIMNLPSGVANGTIVYGKADVVTIEPYNATLKTIGDRDFQSWTHATGLVIGNGFEVVSEYAFYQWTAAKSLVLPNTITTIATNAFQGWSKCNGVIIPNSVTSIGNYAFAAWSKATLLTLPASAVTLGSFAFQNWSAATSLTIPNGMVQIGNNAFTGWSSSKTLSISSTVTNIGTNSFSNWYLLETVTCLAESPPAIASTTFSGAKTGFLIKVPASSVDTYKSATYWSAYSAYISAI